MGETEDEWIDKAEEERLGIIAKYDKGREEGAQIDPWEDPAFEIYHVTDHYGFIHDTRLPTKIGAEEIKRQQIEIERTDKWIKMYRSWTKYKSSDKLKRRTYKGIPNKVRGLFWGLLLDLQPLKEQQKGKYLEMYDLARKHSPDVRQIDLDVNRTYRDHVMFRERYGVKQNSLFNILCAYSIYNSEVGYCQGMSQVAALLLVYLDEEDAFWALAQLMTHPKYGMHGFFIAGFPKLVRFQSHHDRVLTTMLPRLKKHFDKHGIDSGLYTLKWFFQCFLDRVPFELALRLWDIYLLEGEKVLICGAYAILKMHQKQLLAKKNMDDLLHYIQSKIPTNFGMDFDTAIINFHKCVEELHRKKLDTAGEPGDDELPKRPFGVLENLPKPVPVTRETPEERMSKEITMKKDSRAQLAADETVDYDNEEDEDFEETSTLDKASASRISLAATSVASSSIADSPRNFNRPLSSVSNLSYASALQDFNGPSEKSTPVKMNGLNHMKSKSIGMSAIRNQITNEAETEVLRSATNNSKLIASETEVLTVTEYNSKSTTETIEVRTEEISLNVIQKIIEEVDSINLNVSNSSSSSHHSHFHQAQSLTKTPSPPPPPPRSPYQPNSTSSSSYVQEQQYKHVSTPSVFNHQLTMNEENPSSSGAEPPKKKVPPPVSPRKSVNTVNLNIESNSACSSPCPSMSIPSGETVRIHVPYNITSPSHHNLTSTAVSSRNGFDISKNDPNRIKIDVSSHSTLIQ